MAHEIIRLTGPPSYPIKSDDCFEPVEISVAIGARRFAVIDPAAPDRSRGVVGFAQFRKSESAC